MAAASKISLLSMVETTATFQTTIYIIIVIVTVSIVTCILNGGKKKHHEKAAVRGERLTFHFCFLLGIRRHKTHSSVICTRD